MTTTSETLGFAEHLDAAALAAAASESRPEPEALEAPVRLKRSSRKSVLAFAVCALAINGAAAIYTLPFDLPSPDLSKLAALFPRQEEPAPKPDPVVAALKDIFAEEIKKSYEEYVMQVGEEIAKSTPHFKDALNEILAGGQSIF